MILPMMGLLVFAFVAGVLGAALLSLFQASRRFAPFMLAPILGSLGAFALSWGLAVSLEWLFASQSAGGVGFFGGYVGGGLAGVGLGVWWGFRCFSHQLAPNNSIQRTPTRYAGGRR